MFATMRVGGRDDMQSRRVDGNDSVRESLIRALRITGAKYRPWKRGSQRPSETLCQIEIAFGNLPSPLQQDDRPFN